MNKNSVDEEKLDQWPTYSGTKNKKKLARLKSRDDMIMKNNKLIDMSKKLNNAGDKAFMK